jgi:PAS domain S-box-containing protein
MPSQWLAVDAGTDLRARARQIQRSWESLLAGGALNTELPPQATAELRPAIVDSWRRSLATGLDPTDLLPSIEADPSETRERWLEHPLGSVRHVLAAHLQMLAQESNSLVQVTDPSGLTLHLDGPEWLKARAAEMNLVEGARCAETVNGTNGVGTALAADHPVQVFAFEHFSHHHREWVCSGSPVHDPVSGRLVGVLDLSSPWKIAHPRSLELVTTAARTMEQCLLENRRDQDARLRRRYGDLKTKSTDLLVNRDGYVLVGDNSSHPKPLDVPESGGEIAMDDGSLAVAEPLGQGEAYLVRRIGPCAVGAARTKALERAEGRVHEEAGSQRRDANVASGLPSAESDRRVSAYFEAALDCVIMADASGRVVEFNPAAERTFGYTRDEALGRTMAELIVPPSLRERHSAAFARFVETRRGTMLGRRLELTGMRADGSEFPVELALSQVEAEPVLICGALRDISAAKQAEGHLRELADEQAALRRVATLVAHESSPQHLFATVAEQVAQIINVPLVRLVRYESDGSAVELIGGWGESLDPLAVGTHWQLDGPVALARVWQSGRPARVDDYTHLPGQAAAVVRQAGMRSAVACPITVEGRLWGAIAVLSPRHEPFPENTEARLADFTELVATAIANAESRGELAASEARARKLAEEQAALRRIATLVAQESSPDEIFALVAEEVAQVLHLPITGVFRYEEDGSAMRVVGGWSERPFPVPMGTRLPLDGPSHFADVWATGQAARLEDPTDLPGTIAYAMRRDNVGSGAATPILVEGRLWGAMGMGLFGFSDRLPDDIEARLADFTELLATAIANSEARDGLRRLFDEQAALRRVATLVAASAAPSDVFAAVTAEIALVLDANATLLCRADPDGAAVVVGRWGDNTPRLGTRLPQGGRNLTTMVLDTGHPARIESYVDATGDASEVARSHGLRSAVGAPILVEGRLWGLVIAGRTGDEALPPNAEERLAGFSELVATAISNATTRAELVASRARIVAAGDQARRRIERDLHDGAQQQLVTLTVGLGAAKERVPPGLEELQADLAHAADGLTAVLNELREMSRGIHPAILTEGGLGPALKALARRSGIPVEIDVRCDRRLADGVEVAAYFVASEALTNAAKHAEASRVRIAVHLDEATLYLSIRDDGLGGADASRGSGLIGLRDRVEALGGTIDLASPPGGGTRLDVEIPLLAEPSVATNSETLSRV